MSVHSAFSGDELHIPGYVQSDDPGAVGAGKLWVDTTGGTGAWVVKVRNAGDTAWEAITVASMGDMLKSAYDSDDDGTVDAADTATVAEGLDDNGGHTCTAEEAETAYDHTLVTTGNPHAVTAADVGADAAGTLALGTILSSNGTYKGITLTGTVDTNAVGFGAVLCQAADFKWDEADADALATMHGLAVALETGTGSKLLLLQGQVCNTAWDWSAGPVYVSATQGTFTQTAPGAGDFASPVGFALSADTIYFNPSGLIIEGPAA